MTLVEMTTSGSGAYILDHQRKELRHPEKPTLRLTPLHYQLMAYLHANKGKPFSANELLYYVWCDEYGNSSEDTVRMNIYHLRNKANDPNIIDSRKGFGYGVGLYE
jgi:DNA-binding response OmpR family regulator